MTLGHNRKALPSSLVSAVICHCEEHSDAAISTRLSTRRRTAFATATGLPRCARNDIRAQSKGPASSLLPAAICHCEEHSDVAISTRLSTRRRTAFATATGLPRCARNDIRGKSKGPASSLLPAAICHCEEHSDVAISTRLSTRRRSAFATAAGLPRCARNDKVGGREATIPLENPVSPAIPLAPALAGVPGRHPDALHPVPAPRAEETRWTTTGAAKRSI